MTNLSRSLPLILAGALCIAPGLEARTCTGNGDLIGGFGWVGTRTAALTSTATPIVASNTPIGTLAAGAANAGAFAAVGRVFLDGSGGIFASADLASPLLQVGTYTANTDCTISVAITDAFATP